MEEEERKLYIKFLIDNGVIKSEEDVLTKEDINKPNKIPPLIKILEEWDSDKRNSGYDIILYEGPFEIKDNFLQQKSQLVYWIRLDEKKNQISNGLFHKMGLGDLMFHSYDISINLDDIENEPLYKTNRKFIEKIKEDLNGF